jgi:toxin ParE1/3/4
MAYIAEDNPAAALELDLEFEAKADPLPKHPKLYKPGRMKGTREIVVRPNYVMVYAIEGDTITILRVLHTSQQWP